MRSREWYQRGRGCARAVSLPPPRRYHWTLRRAEDDSLPQDAVMDPSPDSPAEPLVSVVMPCLNEARAVGICVEKARRALAAMGVRGEVVVVDNGSSDGSPEIAARAGARVVAERRRGYGAAYLRGFQEARGQYLVMGDADDSYDFLDLERFVEPLRRDGFDMVIGNRLKGTILPGAMPWTHRWIGNPI